VYLVLLMLATARSERCSDVQVLPENGLLFLSSFLNVLMKNDQDRLGKVIRKIDETAVV